MRSRATRPAYKRARKAIEAPYAARVRRHFHDWRKGVEFHRYHLELLAGLWPRQIGGRRKEVKALGGMLGDDHDLVVLEATLAAEPASFGAAGAGLVSELARRRRAELRAAIRPLGQRLFAEPPKALARRFEVYWQATQTKAADGAERKVA